MTASSQRSEELVDLIGELRHNGYSISTEQYIAAQRLLIALAALGDWPGQSSRLGTMLAPVFCTSRDEQENFFRCYEEWRRLQPGLLTEAKKTEEARQTSKRRESAPEETLEQIIPESRIKAWIWPVALAVVIFIIVFVPLLKSSSSTSPILRGIVVSRSGRT